MVDEHERRVLASIADEVDRHRAGDISLQRLLENVWGLFEAAEVRERTVRVAFEDRYRRLTEADDARQPWMPAGLGSASEVDEALDELHGWSLAFRDADDQSPATL